MNPNLKPAIPDAELWTFVDLASLPDSVRIDPIFNDLWQRTLRAKMWSNCEGQEGKLHFLKTAWEPLQQEIDGLLRSGRLDALAEFSRAWEKWEIEEYSEMVELDEESLRELGIDGKFSLPMAGKKATPHRWPLKYYVAMAIIDLQLEADRAPTNSEIRKRIELYDSDSKVDAPSISKACKAMGLAGRLNLKRDLS
jgi:hypothetical protein